MARKKTKRVYTYKQRRNALAAGMRANVYLKGRQSRYKNGQIFSFKRKKDSTLTITMDAATTESHGAWKFMLSDLPNYTEFTALFDKYRISGIKAQFYPRTNVLAQNDLTGALTEVPPIMTVVDYDDASGTDDYLALMQFENARVHQAFKPFSIFFRPKVAQATYSSGAFSGYSTGKQSTWIDASSASVEYYGLKWASFLYAIGNNTTIDPHWDVIFTYYIQTKYPR